ncbi:hypothetical protein AB0F81_31625 [Actinoplanes sp. NPDC024001]
MLTFLLMALVPVLLLTALVAFQRSRGTGNRGDRPAPWPGAQEHPDNRG